MQTSQARLRARELFFNSGSMAVEIAESWFAIHAVECGRAGNIPT